MKFFKSVLAFCLITSAALGAGVTPSNQLKIGNGTATDKKIIFNRGSNNPGFKWNEGTSKLQFSNDGSSFSDFSGGAPTHSEELSNLGLSVTISSNTLVVALKQADGSTNPSTGAAAVLIGFRSATSTAGAYSQVSFTAASSITLGSTDSIGVTASVSAPVFVYAIQDTTSELCLSNSILDEGALWSASALTGGADTAGATIWCPSAHTSRPIRAIGRAYATFSNPNWGSVATVSVAPFNPELALTRIRRPARHEWVGYSGDASYGAACTSSPCTIVRQSGDVAANGVTRSSQGIDVVTFSTPFADAPECRCTVDSATAGTAVICQTHQTSTTQVTISTLDKTATPQDSGAHVECDGFW